MERAASVGSFLWVIKGDSRNRLDDLYASCSNMGNTKDGLKYTKKSGDSGYLADIELELDENKTYGVPKTYKRRFYILLLFSVSAFMQYCCWNTFGPISTTCMVAFDWTESEIALMASLDPITYLLTMLLFSYIMDVKGLRLSMIISLFFMTLGTGLRCITSEKGLVTWSMAAGQFFNGLAGPVTQAAPPLLSANWFPANERTTATAIASLCGSLGVALSFIISPSVVKDIPVMAYKFPQLKYKKRLLNDNYSTAQYLSETVFQDALHYWPINPEKQHYLNQALRTKKLKKIFPNYKINRPLREIGQVLITKGVNDHAVTILQDKGWLSGNNIDNPCLFNPNECKNGLSVLFWVKLFRSTGSLLTTTLNKTWKQGISISQSYKHKNAFIKIKIGTRSKLWSLKTLATVNTWMHIAATWNNVSGLSLYINGTLKVQAKRSYDIRKQARNTKRTIDIGKTHRRKATSKATFDEIALWDRVLNQSEIYAVKFSTSHHGNLWTDENYVAEVNNRVVSIMNLLYAEFGVNVIIFILILVYFPDKPPTPPSVSAHLERDNFKEGTKRLLKNPQFWTLCFIYGVTTGVYSGWGAVLNVNLSTFGITQEEAGWLGFYTMLAGIGAGMMLARCADLFSGRMKFLLLLLFVGATSCFLWFSLLCLKIIPFDKDSLYKSAVLGGFFVSGTIPLFYELTIEQTYPIPEGITIGLFTMVNNAVTVLFLLALMIPTIGTVWMNWVLFGSCALSLPVLIVFSEKYNRLEIDICVEEKINLKSSENTTSVPNPCCNGALVKPRPCRIAVNGSLWSLPQQHLVGFLKNIRTKNAL